VKAAAAPSRQNVVCHMRKMRWTRMIYVKTRQNYRRQKIEQFVKLVLPCSLRSHRKTNPSPKIATPYLALPARHPKQETFNRILLKNF